MSPRPQPKPNAPFDIDNYLNPFIPRNPLYLLPAWASHWFGYRPPHTSSTTYLFSIHLVTSKYHLHTLLLYFSVLVGCFCGVAIIENVLLALPPLSGHTVPIAIASFGAAAILEYNTIESPLAQPRNLILGHFISATVAVGITKLFLHIPPDRFEQLRWLVGALTVGAASVLMSVTKTVHPPAGATALLAATNLEIQELGWWLLPLVLLSAMLMLASALLLNNAAGRRFPIYWWTPVDLKALREERRRERRARRASFDVGGDVDAEKAKDADEESQSPSEESEGGRPDRKDENFSDTDTEAGSADLHKAAIRDTDMHLTRAVSYSSTSRVPRLVTVTSQTESQGRRRSRSKSMTGAKSVQEDGAKRDEEDDEDERIIITKHRIIVPERIELSDWEDEVLRILMERLRDA